MKEVEKSKKYNLCQNESSYLHLEVHELREYQLKLLMEHRLEINLNQKIYC